MADAAVRVDIIVGQNTVIKSTEMTEASLARLMGTSRKAESAFTSLSGGGLRKLETGFRTLAFQAAGVPGPMGKIAEGALLLGGGSGVLLGVAAAAGAVALAWQALTKHSRELASAIKDLNALLPKNDDAAEKAARLWKEYGDMMRQASALEARANRPGALFAAATLRADAAALRDKAAALKALLDTAALTVDVMGGGDKATRAGGSKASDLDYRMAVGLTGGPQLAAMADNVTALRETLIAPLEEMPAQIGAAFSGINDEFLTGLQITSDFIDAMNATLLWGMVDLGTALADALGSGKSIGKVLVDSLGQMMQQIGRLLIEFGVALVGLRPLLSNLFTSGPAMIAAGVLIAAAGAAVSKAATSQSVSSHAASGGVNSGQQRSDQQEMTRGTVTITMGRGAFIDPRSPEFQEWLAQVMKEAKGRNVVFA